MTITSPPRPSSGIPACRSTTRATWSIGDWSSGRSTAPASSTCAAIPTPAASGRRACPMPTGCSGWSIPTSSARRQLQGRAQLHRHRAVHRRSMVRPGLRQFVGLRSVAVPRRRRPQMVRQHAVEPRPTASAAARSILLRRHPAAGIRPGDAAKLVGPAKNIFAGSPMASSRARISSSATAGTI